ncbi:hypothetical protein V8F20_012151 [Naviculisporaceae sp. PSN 640]
MAPIKQHLILIFTLLFSTPVLAATYTDQFRDWYPQYGHIFHDIRNLYCADEYAAYLTGIKNHSNIDIIGGGGIYTVVTQPVINCILNHTSDYVKNGMTSAQVLLGVMPTVLAILGASTEEMSMLSNVARRPGLALLLAAGSPSVYFSRAFEYHDPGVILADHPARLPQWRPRRWYSYGGISVLEYLVGIVACGNIVVMNWELGIRTICSFWTDGVLAPTVWAVTGIITHLLGMLVLRLRLVGWRGKDAAWVRRKAEEKKENERKRVMLLEGEIRGYKDMVVGQGRTGVGRATWNWIKRIPARIWKILMSTEFVPAATAGYQVRIITFVERKTFLVAAWIVSMFTVIHIIYGTLVFASTTFIGTQDALVILARYVGSVVCCRIVLMYELAGLRESCVGAVVAAGSRRKRRLEVEEEDEVDDKMSVDSLNMGLPTSTAREQVALKRWVDQGGVGVRNSVVVESSYLPDGR